MGSILDIRVISDSVRLNLTFVQRLQNTMFRLRSYTFENIGLPADFHLAAAEIFNFVGHTPLAEEMPETLDTTCTLMETIDLFAKWLKEMGLH